MNPELESYLLEHMDEEPALLKELNRYTQAHVLSPRMMSGPLQGRLLSFFSKMIRPENILEIGTYTGYGTLCLAEGLPEGGHIHTIEINDEIVHIARHFFEKAGLENQISLHIGSALSVIPTLDKPFDLVYLDADKSQYCDYFRLVFDKVRKGGYILADNTLWNGLVIREQDLRDKSGKGILAFNEMIKKDLRIEKVILPVRDGLTLIRKI